MNLDRTFCASPNCKNECGREASIDVLRAADKNGRPLSWAYFCGEPERVTEPSETIKDD